MRILLLLTFLFYTLVYANEQKRALQTCEVFNNMKHSKNSGQQRLKKGVFYRVLREQGDQYYVTVPSIPVPNRWVDKSCFDTNVIPQTEKSKIKKSETKKSPTDKKKTLPTTDQPKDLLLALSWHNAFCETHQYKRECRQNRTNRYGDNAFVLHGLWPQPRNNLYCNVPNHLKQYDKNRQWNRIPSLALSKKTKHDLQRVMPGFASHLQRHEWIKHGTCYGTSPEVYYSEAISLVQQVNDSKLGHFFRSNQGKVVTLQQVRFKVDESFGKGSGKRAELRCKNGMITELWLHLGYGDDELSTLLKKGKPIRSRCQKGRIDRAGFR